MSLFDDWHEQKIKFNGDSIIVYWYKEAIYPMFEQDGEDSKSLDIPILREAVVLWAKSGFKYSISLQEFLDEVLNEK